ncbi:MAG: hypothetical protein IPN07_05440 [Dehalococcoidia bacterium]|nr:hypothetical protein [Dehalococcoidia bacterium]
MPLQNLDFVLDVGEFLGVPHRTVVEPLLFGSNLRGEHVYFALDAALFLPCVREFAICRGEAFAGRAEFLAALQTALSLLERGTKVPRLIVDFLQGADLGYLTQCVFHRQSRLWLAEG